MLDLFYFRSRYDLFVRYCEKEVQIMKVTKVLAVIFGIFTICGAIYIFYTEGRADTGYEVVPMILCLVFSQWERPMGIKHKQKNENHL